MTVAVEHEVLQNKQEKKLNQLYLEAAQREINQFREQTQLLQLDRILQLEKEQEDPRIRTGLRQLKQRLENLVKDLEEEYRYATNQVLNLDRKDFEAMQEYEQRILMERFTRQIKQCKSELLREQYQAKYRELLGVSLENLDKIHDVEDEEE
ncbi:8553_t:CDS:2 [Racocetra persica]|uniref:8553_t:CDS:1 n=1 Tax=Racocetra persica TaxID=160502 RepID=A0ACA9Q4W5_9GLOM|nr:8553_t:CDS:2 [Racocetra persica]